MLFQFLLYSSRKVNQLYIYIHPLFFGFLSNFILTSSGLLEDQRTRLVPKRSHVTNFNYRLLLKNLNRGFPGGAAVENLPANAGNTGSSPGLGRSHMPRSNQAHEPQLLSLHVWSLCSATREAAIVRGPRTAMKSDPHSPQLEKALAQKRRPNTAKNNK